MEKEKLSLPKAIIDELHQYFVQQGIDNYDHIMTLKRVIIAVCKFFPDESEPIKNELFEYAFDLFWDEWKVSLEEEDEDEEYDLKKEYRTARRIFEQTYEKEENIWLDD